MPGRNGMGPLGQGPMTGRGVGWCRDANAQVDMPVRGAGFGMGRGGGRGGGWRHRHRNHATGQMGWPGPDVGVPPTFSKAQELAALKQQAESLEQSLEDLKASIQEIEQSRQDAKKK